LARYPFRLGTTSYILPDDILPNVRYLAGQVKDIELVLFEVDDGPNNLPTGEVLAELAALGHAMDLSYTVHLPLDLRLSAAGDATHPSMLKAEKVIACTRGLDPWAYVLHLDGRDIKHRASAAAVAEWQDQTVRALEIAAGWAGGAEKLAVENLETYPLDFILPIVERVPVMRCVDIGHLWLDGHDPVPYLTAALPRTRVIHLHGLAERDHKSLAHMPPEKLNPVVSTLARAGYSGVLTLEVFGQADFDTSVAALATAWQVVQEPAP
jgi:adenosylcobalamin phosphodiesterase